MRNRSIAQVFCEEIFEVFIFEVWRGDFLVAWGIKKGVRM